MRAKLSGGIVVDPLSVKIAAGNLSGHFAMGGPEKAVAGDLHTNLPDLSDAFELAWAAARRLGRSRRVADRHREPALGRAEFVQRREPA